MKRISLIVATLFLLTSLSSCFDDKEKEIKKARSVGGSSEILMVTQNDEQWNGQMGQAVRDFFEEEQYGLPQPEKNFKVSHINLDALNDMFKKHRNLIIAKIDKDRKTFGSPTGARYRAEHASAALGLRMGVTCHTFILR